MSRRGILLIGISVAVLSVALRSTFFCVSVRNVPVTADESISILLSTGITQSKDLEAQQAKRNPEWPAGRFPLLFMSQPHLFPLESYLGAPFNGWLPRNAVGARILPAFFGLVTIVCSILILLRLGPLRRIWPGALLVLFPSAYVLTLQVAYGLPGYPSLMMLAAVLILGTQASAGTRKGWIGWALLSGLLAGLLCSGTLLAFPVLVGVGAMVCLGRNWKRTCVSVPLYAVGAAVGLIPFLAAKRLYPGAYGEVSGIRPWSEAKHVLWPSGLDFTFPTVMGARCCDFPDSKETTTLLNLFSGDAAAIPETARWFCIVFSVVCLAVLLWATALCVWRFLPRLKKDKWPTIVVADVLVAVSWICFAMYLANRRAHYHDFRYLLLPAWVFPLVIGALYAGCGRRMRIVLGCLAVVLTLLNIGTAAAVMQRWSQPRFAADFVRFHDVTPVVEYLEERGIDRCFGTYMDAYRINHASDERIICAQAYNERFPGWPLPYKQLVDSSTNVAYALTYAWVFPPGQMEIGLTNMGIGYTVVTCGDFRVYTDFQCSAPRAEIMIPAHETADEVAHNPEHSANLNDGNYLTRWSCVGVLQTNGMWAQMNLLEPKDVCRISMYYDHYAHDRAPALDVLVRIDGEWQTAATNVAMGLDAFKIENGHPVCGNETQTIRFEPVRADAVRVRIAEADASRAWTIGEIELYETSETNLPSD